MDLLLSYTSQSYVSAVKWELLWLSRRARENQLKLKDPRLALQHRKSNKNLSNLIFLTGREALIGHVEEDVEVLLFDKLRQLLPLLRLRVDTGRIVRAGVQQDHALLGNVLKIQGKIFRQL
jgi:hypothetical protein